MHLCNKSQLYSQTCICNYMYCHYHAQFIYNFFYWGIMNSKIVIGGELSLQIEPQDNTPYLKQVNNKISLNMELVYTGWNQHLNCLIQYTNDMTCIKNYASGKHSLLYHILEFFLLFFLQEVYFSIKLHFELFNLMFQMEFYFSDSNLAKDRFMKNLIQSSENGCKYNAVSGNEKYRYMFLLFVLIFS